ncbi:MAG: tol-pal system protein YbgF [bacterium]|nr:tol-pal system protein YbgF [bacterium]
MNRHKTSTVAAIFAMAVIFIGLFSGCATKRDAEEIKAQIAELEAQNRQTTDLVARMDSLITAGAEANRKLTNDVRYSTDELTRQLGQLLENYNDLMTRIDQMAGQQVVRLAPTSSPGAQTDVSASGPTTTTPPPPAATSSTDCIDAYDNAFTLVRRGEYDPAIEGFRSYLADCEGDENVPSALYWVGESFFAQEKYTLAIAEYEKLMNGFPDSPNNGRALYKLARCKQELDKTDEAKRLYQQLIDDFPGTFEAEQAENLLKDL